MVGELAELFEAIAAIDDTRIHEGGRPAGRRGSGRVFLEPRGAARGVRRIRGGFPTHGARIEGPPAGVNAPGHWGSSGQHHHGEGSAGASPYRDASFDAGPG
jgi:hypothetical protein